MKVVSFGEILLRLAALGYTKLFQKDCLEATFCGGEVNASVSLANFGVDSVFVTKLPDSDVGRAAVNAVRYFGVNTEKIIFGNGRMGLYYLEKGASQRPSKVIYDRGYSAISLAENTDFDWNDILDGADWFHWTGINPSLSVNLAKICEEACIVAKSKGITVSCDLNFRSKLWTSKQAQNTMKPLMKYVDVCICNEEDAEKVLGIQTVSSDVSTGKINKHDYVLIAEKIFHDYGCSYIATTLRNSYSASRNGWSAVLYDSTSRKPYYSNEYDIQIVDRVGGGDSFAAGLIYAMINKMDMQHAVDFAVAASCLKQTIEGDFNRSSVADVEALIKSGGSARIVR